MDKKILIVIAAVVILIVVIVVGTVLLAAVCAFFMYAQNQPTQQFPEYEVSVSATRLDDSAIKIVNQGGRDVGQLDSARPFVIYVDGQEADATLGPDVGSSCTITADQPSGTHVLVYGMFKDNYMQPLLDGYY